MHSLVKEQKKSTFTVPFLGPSGGTKNETAKSQNPQQRPTLATNKNCNCIYLSNQHIDLEQYTCKVFTCTKLSQGHRAILCFLLHPQDLPAQMADSFFLSEPVAFRRVYGLESYSRTSGESNHHRQSVSDTRMPRYQLSHEDDSRSNGGLVRCPVCLQVGGQRNWQCIWMCSTSSRILGWTLHMLLWTYHRTNCWPLNSLGCWKAVQTLTGVSTGTTTDPLRAGCIFSIHHLPTVAAEAKRWWVFLHAKTNCKLLLRKIFPVQALVHANVHLCLPFVSWIQTVSSNDQVLQLWM